MLTIVDCIAMSGVDEESLELVSRHEHLPFAVAVEKAHDFSIHEWGDPAFRQMALDELKVACEGRDCRRVAEALEILNRVSGLHSGGSDRRTRH